MKRRWLGLVSLLAAFSLVIAACGDDDTADTTAAPTETTATTAAPTTTAAPATTVGSDDAPDYAFDVGVTPAPCADAVNEGNACIYLGVISDLTVGPFAALGVPLTKAQEDFWADINANGGVDGFDVLITTENTVDAQYDPAQTAEGATLLSDRVIGLAQSLGTAQTAAALPTLAENNMVAAPATWFSGWAFDEVDQGLVMEVGASYCIEAMNGMSFLAQARETTDFTWSIVYFPGDYGGDYLAGAKVAAAQLGIGPPLDEIGPLVPLSFGGDVTEAIATLAASKPDVVVMVTGPTEMATITGGLFGTGHQFQVIGAGPTWNVALKASEAMPLLEAVYFNTAPWAGWDYDSPGHEHMRAVAEAAGQGPHNSYTAGWMFQYTWLALIKEAIASGDLTRANMVALAADLENIDFEGMLPTASYAGTPNEYAGRLTIVSRASAAASDGLEPVTDLFASPLASDFDLAAPCFVG
jgi:ABC-type branched-subunit amino acid transport system substrate-binding protein